MRTRPEGPSTLAGRRRLRRWISASSVALVLGLVVAWAIGTQVSLLTTRGGSMSPIFRPGDLAVTREADAYAVGDIVAYKSEPNGLIVLHRIVEINNGRYSFKGDANSFIDPDRPTADKLIGSLSFRIPGAGMVADWMTNRTRVVLAFFGVLVVALGTGTRKKIRGRPRGRRRHARGDPSRSSPTVTDHGNVIPVPSRPAPDDFKDLLRSLSAPLVGLVVALIALLAAFSTPSTRTTTTDRPYTQRVTYDYSAAAPPSYTYPDGIIRTGSPVFFKLVKVLQLSTSYQFTGPAGHRVSGTYALDAELSSSANPKWKRTIPLTTEKAFVGDSIQTESTLDLVSMQAVVTAMAAETGTGVAGVIINIVPRVTVSGAIDGVAFTDGFDTPLRLALDPQELSFPEPTKGDDGALGASKASSVSAPTFVERDLSLLGRKMSVDRARIYALLALLGTMVWTGLAMASMQRQRHRVGPDQIRHRYHASMVEVGSLPPGVEPVDVSDMAMLGKIAEHGQHLILHHQEANGLHTYLVDDSNVVYRFRTATASAPLTATTPTAATTSAPTEPPINPSASSSSPVSTLAIDQVVPANDELAAPIGPDTASSMPPGSESVPDEIDQRSRVTIWSEAPAAGDENLPQTLADALRLRPLDESQAYEDSSSMFGSAPRDPDDVGTAPPDR